MHVNIEGNTNKSHLIYNSENSSVNVTETKEPIHLCDNTQVDMSTCKAICLTCMDFRTVDDTVYQLNKRLYLNNYDHVGLAGASLGYIRTLDNTNSTVMPVAIAGTNYEYWEQMFNDHIELAGALHSISEVVIIDHMYCGAYKYSYPELLENMGTYLEFNKHMENLYIAKEKILTKYDNQYTVRMFIIGIDGCTFYELFDGDNIPKTENEFNLIFKI
mgnify:CR=1 FL=1